MLTTLGSYCVANLTNPNAAALCLQKRKNRISSLNINLHETQPIQWRKIRQMFNLPDRLLTQHDSAREQTSMDNPVYHQFNLSCSVFLQTFVLSRMLQEKPQGGTLVGDLSKLFVFDIVPLICAV